MTLQTPAAPAAVTPPATTETPTLPGVALAPEQPVTSEQSQQAPASPAAPEPVTPAPTSGDVPGSGDNASADYLNGLSAEAKALAEANGWKSVEDIIKSYDAVKKDADARPVAGTPPAKAEDYKFNLPENADKIGYNHEFASEFKNELYKLGAPQELAAGIHDWFVKFASNDVAAKVGADVEVRNQQIADTHKQLTKDWGHDTTEGFKRSAELMQRSLRLLDPDLKTALKTAGLVTEVANREYVTNAGVARALAKVGASMYSEDAVHSVQAQSTNPFDPKTENMSLQGHIFRTNPQRAAQLIRAAGSEAMMTHEHLLRQIEAKR